MLLIPLIIFMVVVFGLRILMESRKNYPPGPFNIPFFGCFEQLKLANTVMHKNTKTLGDRYGNLIFLKLFMDEPLLIVRGYDMINEASHSRAIAGVGRALTFREHGLYRRRGLIFADGEPWRHMRHFVVRTLRSQGFGRKMLTDNINDELANVLSLLKSMAVEGRDVNVRHLFTLASANSILRLMVGQQISEESQVRHLAQLVDRNASSLGPSYMHLDMFPWLRHVAPVLSGYRQFHNDVLELVNLFQPLIASQAATIDDRLKSDEPPANLVEAFLREQRRGQHPETFNEENLRAMLKDLFMAGMETTNTAMEWVLLALVRHPDIQARAAAEVDEVIGQGRSPTIEDIPSLPYLGAVLEETLRWMTPVPIAQHAVNFGATRLGGFHIPANCRVLFDLHSVLYDKETWGDPEAFRPERFLGPDASRLRAHMISFGLGMRHCIGEAHARQSMYLFTAGLLQRMRLRLSPGQPDDLHRSEVHLIMKPQNFRFTVHLRE